MINTCIAVLPEILRMYNVPLDTRIPVGTDGFFEGPIKDRLFYGQDNAGRTFVNLPINIEAGADVHPEDELDTDWKNSAFTLFERYSSVDNQFAVRGGVDPLTTLTFLGSMGSDLSLLCDLLAGGTVHIRHPLRVANNAECWIKITLKR